MQNENKLTGLDNDLDEFNLTATQKTFIQNPASKERGAAVIDTLAPWGTFPQRLGDKKLEETTIMIGNGRRGVPDTRDAYSDRISRLLY